MWSRHLTWVLVVAHVMFVPAPVHPQSVSSTTLTAPSGTLATDTPTYSWTAVASAAQYLLWVDDSAGGRIRQWYTAAEAGCASGSGVCSITPNVPLASGVGQWWVVAADASGSGPWSAPLTFTVPGVPPPSPTTVTAPSGILTVNTPTYRWTAVPSAAQYLLWVDDSTGGKVRQWYTAAQAGCGSGAGACSVTPTVPLAPGNGQCWVVAADASHFGSWSAPLTFTVPGVAPPSPATLTAPSGTLLTDVPTYTWTAVAGATQYLLWVDDSVGGRIRRWYTAAEAGCSSGAGACSVTPNLPLAPGNGQWWVVAADASGFGSWSAPLTFTVPGVAPPGPATLTAPSGTLLTDMPTYTWTAVAGATQYLLWVNDSAGGRIRQWYTAAEAGCASGTGTCSVTPNAPLAPGDGQWWVVAADAAGFGSWSSSLAFTYPLDVAIDIKGKKIAHARGKHSAGVIPVTILGTETFDATEADPATIQVDGVEVRRGGPTGEWLCRTQDANGDGFLDLVCLVQAPDLTAGATSIVLTAETFDGLLIRGEASIMRGPPRGRARR